MPNTKQASKTERTQSETTLSGPDVPTAAAFLFGWNMEMAQFYFRRYQQYCTSPVSFMACRSVEELRVRHAEFLQQMMSDYRENAHRLSMIAGWANPNASLDSEYASKLIKAQEDAAAIIEQAKVKANRILESANKQTSSNEENQETTPETTVARKRA
jgi:hypothetical protein